MDIQALVPELADAPVVAAHVATLIGAFTGTGSVQKRVAIGAAALAGLLTELGKVMEAEAPAASA